MQTSIKINTKKLSRQVADIESISKKNKWSFLYDPDLDSLYYSAKEVKNGYSLFSINKELSIYINKDSDLGGVFIEYYQSNLASHDKKFIPFADIFTTKTDSMATVGKSEKQKEDAVLLSEVIKAELLSNLVKSEGKDIFIHA